MAFFFVLTGYLAAALSLITGAFLGLAILTSSVESEQSNGNRPKLANKGDPAKHIVVEPKPSVQVPGQAFRYGPDVNHGQSGTPVSATKQALTQAKVKVTAPKKRQQPYQERIVQDPGVAISFAPVQSSGH
jgi:hypothetical protein